MIIKGSKINSNNFNKDDFYTFSSKENASVKNVHLKNLNDESHLKLDQHTEKMAKR